MTAQHYPGHLVHGTARADGLFEGAGLVEHDGAPMSIAWDKAWVAMRVHGYTDLRADLRAGLRKPAAARE